MSGQLRFFRKNFADYEKGTITVTASQDSGDTANLILDRSNRTAWGTTGSVDSDNTTLLIDFLDVARLDSLFLIGHNFASFLIEYYDDTLLAYVTLEDVTGNTATTNFYSFTVLTSSKIRITIRGTQTTNSDKVLQQFIATSSIGQFNGWPVLKKPLLARNIKQQQMLSGKMFVSQTVGRYSVSAQITVTSDSSDLSLVETLQNATEGFLFWPCGGSETQFSSVRQGYTLQDIFLVRCANEFSPEFYLGLYKSGQVVNMDFVEVIT